MPRVTHRLDITIALTFSFYWTLFYKFCEFYTFEKGEYGRSLLPYTRNYFEFVATFNNLRN